MLVVPNIAGYKPLMLQFTGDIQAHDTREWGLIAKTNPYPLFPDIKEPYKNEWADEDGDDEYTPPNSARYQSISFEVTFYAKTKGVNAAAELRLSLYELFDRMAASGTFAYFDTYTQTGWLKVRYDGYEEDEFVAKEDWARAIFKMKFKAIEPSIMAQYNAIRGTIDPWFRPLPSEPIQPTLENE